MRNGEEPPAATTPADVERLFPGWYSWVSDTGRWWAARRVNLSPAELSAGGRAFLRGPGMADLIAGIEEQEQLLPSPGGASRKQPGPASSGPGLIRESARVFSGRKDQIAAARHFAAEVIGDVPAREEAILLASELATNALIHTASGNGGKSEVTACLASRSARVEVKDGGSPGSMQAPRPLDALSEEPSPPPSGPSQAAGTPTPS